MAFSTRSLDEIGAAVRGAFRQFLPGTDATLRQAFVWVSAKVVALLAREYELRLAWIYAQLFVRTVTDMAMLRMHGADYRIYQKTAAAASGAVTGMGQAGVTYPAGIRLYSAGVTYVTTAPFTAAGDGTVSALVQAESRGAATNRDAGAALTLADPALYPSLSQDFDVGPDGLGGGADIEDLESLRKRILARKAKPPQGGALGDYETFALEVPGVLKAWAHGFSNGVGSIVVFFLFTGRTDNIPEPADVAAVQAHIDGKRLIRVDEEVAVAPIPAPLAVTIADLDPDTPEIRAAIEANIRAVLYARARPGLAAAPFVLSRSWISQAISDAAGEDSHSLVVPATETITYVGGQIPVLGTVTYA
ncbi:MAG: baseplate J/gp47 family protein [Pseudomonadota bacterium]